MLILRFIYLETVYPLSTPTSHLRRRQTPDGYSVNVAAWEQALNRAAKRGYTSSRGVRVRSGSTTSV
jgi:hypothetical protein